MSVIDDYLANVQEPQHSELQRVRKLIVDTAPDSEEAISYGMPAFKYKKKYLIGFCPFKHHMSLFPGAEVIASLKKELGAHAVAKGTIQFTIEDPLPDELIQKVVKLRMQAIDAKS